MRKLRIGVFDELPANNSDESESTFRFLKTKTKYAKASQEALRSPASDHDVTADLLIPLEASQYFTEKSNETSWLQPPNSLTENPGCDVQQPTSDENMTKRNRGVVSRSTITNFTFFQDNANDTLSRSSVVFMSDGVATKEISSESPESNVDGFNHSRVLSFGDLVDEVQGLKTPEILTNLTELQDPSQSEHCSSTSELECVEEISVTNKNETFNSGQESPRLHTVVSTCSSSINQKSTCRDPHELRSCGYSDDFELDTDSVQVSSSLQQHTSTNRSRKPNGSASAGLKSYGSKNSATANVVKKFRKPSKKPRNCSPFKSVHSTAVQVSQPRFLAEQAVPLGLNQSTFGLVFATPKLSGFSDVCGSVFEPRSIAKVTVDDKSLEKYTSVEPSLVALDNVLRQQVKIVRDYLETQERLHQSMIAVINRCTITDYPTWETTLKLIQYRCHQ